MKVLSEKVVYSTGDRQSDRLIIVNTERGL